MELDIEAKLIEYLKDLTELLRLEIHKLFQTNKDLTKEIKLGADGEPTTYIDKFAEDFLLNAISKKFKCSIMSEEVGTKNFGDKNLLLIIDPIDGTTNAKRKLPFFSCSIGILKNKILVAGIVKDLYNGDCFYAIKGQGAYYNNVKTRIISTNNLKDSFFLLSRPSSQKDNMQLRKIANNINGYRMFGCPSLEICYVACGKAHGAIQIHEKPRATMMDIAAAKIILEEAGGKLVDDSGKNIEIIVDPKYRFNFIATSGIQTIQDKFLSLVL